MINIRYAFIMLLRDWRSGELRILFSSIVLAVASLTAVNFFTNRLHHAMLEMAAEMLAADLIVESSNPIAQAYSQEAKKYNLQVSQTVDFRSVIFSHEKPVLVEVKAVDKNYPLRGVLKINSKQAGLEQETKTIPGIGQAWLEPRLLSLLQSELDNTVKLGEKQLTLTQLLLYEPDRGGNLYSAAPRLLFNKADLVSTGLIQHGTRIRYRLLLSGHIQSLKKFRNKIQPLLQAGERILDVKQARPELRIVIQRSKQLLGFAALICVLLSGIAIATTAKHFTQRHLKTAAIMRCIGAKQSKIVKLFSLQLIYLAVFASTLGIFVGYLAHLVLVELLGSYLFVYLPAPNYMPMVKAYVLGVFIVIGFAIPPIAVLKNVASFKILQQQLTGLRQHSLIMYFSVSLVMFLIMLWVIDDVKLVLYLYIGTVLALLLLSFLAAIFVSSLKRMKKYSTTMWRFGLANIVRKSSTSIIQITVFGIGIMVLLLMSLLRTDILQSWIKQLPNNAANHFMINIQTHQLDAVKTYVKKSGLQNISFYPMVRARLISINDKFVTSDDYSLARAKHMITREFNLSWSHKLKSDNQLIVGHWWTDSEAHKPWVSIEQKLADLLGIKINDVLTFNAAGTKLKLKVVNFRKINWATFNVNFYTVTPPNALQGTLASWIAGFHLSNDDQLKFKIFNKNFPNITIIDVDSLMQKIRVLMNRIASAIEWVFLFTVLAGIALMFAIIQANQDERRYEHAILRTLGASTRQLFWGLCIEFVILGSLAGLLASIIATTIAWVIAVQIFKIQYIVSIQIIIIGIIFGAFIVGVFGILGTRAVLREPPIITLQKI